MLKASDVLVVIDAYLERFPDQREYLRPLQEMIADGADVFAFANFEVTEHSEVHAAEGTRERASWWRVSEMSALRQGGSARCGCGRQDCSQ